MSRYTNPVPQIEDDDGKPIVGAKKYFFETGTSTLKTVYSDAALSLPIDNPVLSDSGGRFPSIFIDGIYREVQHDDKGVQLWDEDPIGELPTGQAQLWSVSTTYNIPEIVYGSDDEYYRSLTDANIGNNPTTSPAAWENIIFLGIWNTNITYGPTDTVIGSDGILYLSRIVSNFGNNPVANPGDWEPIGKDRKSADIPSGATTDLSEATGNYVDITGTTAITSFGTVDTGNKFVLQFDDSLTLTYNATSLILPGNANIITQAGDVAEFISLGVGNWVCTNYQKDSNTIQDDTKPSFSVHRNGTDQANITGTDKIDWTTAEFDTNSDFASGTFTPTVAGKYSLSLTLGFFGLIAGDLITISIGKNGTVNKSLIFSAADIIDGGSMTVVFDANGSTDSFEAFASNLARDTSSIYGATTRSHFSGSKIN